MKPWLAAETPPPSIPPAVPLPVVYVSESVVWEYKRVMSKAPLDETDLNTLGREGWEMAGVLARSTRVIFYFKREAR